MSRACLGKLIVCSIKIAQKRLFSHLRVRRRRPAAGCGGDGTVSVALHEEEILVGSNPRPALHSCAWTHTAICWPAEVSHISRLFSRLLKLAASAVCSQPEPVAARRVLLPAATASWRASQGRTEPSLQLLRCPASLGVRLLRTCRPLREACTPTSQHKSHAGRVRQSVSLGTRRVPQRSVRRGCLH